MELIVLENDNHIIDESLIVKNESKHFIEANTLKVDLNHLKNECIIPVFAKDNETTISHYQFIKSVGEVITELLGTTDALIPDIRVSHIIKGRIPSAIGKPVNQLLDEEKTIYYERMAFVYEIPFIEEVVNNNKLRLCIGGVRAYNQENLFSKKSIEKFKIFIGFKNTVCTNLCISTDGLKSDVRISNLSGLKQAVMNLVNSYDRIGHLNNLRALNDQFLTDDQFAYLIGKMKMFPFLDKSTKKNEFQLSINDSQINTIVRDYFQDENFSKSENNLSLWNFYNLCTEANKNTYIDSNLEKNVNMYEFSKYLEKSLKNNQKNYFIQ